MVDERGLTSEARASRNVTIRMAEADLHLARKQAEEKGLPYQTYTNSVLHEALVRREWRRGQVSWHGFAATRRSGRAGRATAESGSVRDIPLPGPHGHAPSARH